MLLRDTGIGTIVVNLEGLRSTQALASIISANTLAVFNYLVPDVDEFSVN